MADHKRKTIRDGVKALLVAGVPGLAGRVYSQRMFPVQRDELPCAVVFTSDESSLRNNLNRRTLTRSLAVVVAIKASGAEDEVEDAVDALAVLVEQALADKGFGIAGVQDSYLERTTTSLDGQSQLPLGSLALVYRVAYRTQPESPDAFA